MNRIYYYEAVKEYYRWHSISTDGIEMKVIPPLKFTSVRSSLWSVKTSKINLFENIQCTVWLQPGDLINKDKA